MSSVMARPEILPQRLKPEFGGPETAGINACSTPLGTAVLTGAMVGIPQLQARKIYDVGDPLMATLAGAKAPIRESFYAALKGRSSTCCSSTYCSFTGGR
jgi:hypothetical protein